MKVGVAYVNVHVSRCSKEELAWAIDKQLQVISNKILFKTVLHTTKKLKNKAALIYNNIICIAMWPLVTYSN